MKKMKMTLIRIKPITIKYIKSIICRTLKGNNIVKGVKYE